MSGKQEKSIGEWSYEQFAERYAARVESKPHNAYLVTPARRALIPEVKGWRVFDAGCGPGQNAAWLLDQGAASVLAVDITPAFVEIAGERLSAYGERAEVLHVDLTEPLSFADDESFDFVLCQLVLDYISDWVPVFAEFHRLLKPGGALVFSSGHPLGDWLYAIRYIGDHSYFETRLFDAQWGGFGEPRPTIRSYRRPLADILNPVMATGFCLDEILEPQPTEQFKEADLEDYEHAMHTPSFLCVRARKPSVGQAG